MRCHILREAPRSIKLAYNHDNHEGLTHFGGVDFFHECSSRRLLATQDGTGTIYPAELAVAPNGKFLYVAEDVGDRLAAVTLRAARSRNGFLPIIIPSGVALTTDGQVFVSAWGGSTLSPFRVFGRRHARVSRPDRGRSASVAAGGEGNEYVRHAGSDRVAVVDTKLRKRARSARCPARCPARGQHTHPSTINLLVDKGDSGAI